MNRSDLGKLPHRGYVTFYLDTGGIGTCSGEELEQMTASRDGG